MLELVLVLSSVLAVAEAKPPPVVTTCPWSGAPSVENFSPNSVTISGVKYRVGGGKDMLYFTNVLRVCKAESAVPALAAWQQAQNAVEAQGALMAAAAVSWGAKIAQAQTEKERNELIAAAAAEETAAGVVLKQLADAAAAQRDNFMLMLAASNSTASN